MLLALALLLIGLAVSGGPRASSESSIEAAFGRRLHRGKVHPDLYALEGRRRGGFDAFQRRYGTQIGEGFVTVSAVPAGGGPGLLADLERVGLVDGNAAEKMVTGRLPIESIDDAGELDSLRFIRPEWIVRSAVQGQGDAAMKGEAAKATFGVTGAGVTVGTLSDSFNCQGAAFQDEIADVQVLKEGPCADEPSDEGRAMMEHIADVAPGAKQLFHTAAKTQLDFAQGILALRDAGADVINDDIGYVTEPWFQDGIVTQAVDAVVADGVSYFTAAGNSGRSSYQSPYRPGTIADPTGVPFNAHDFDPGPVMDATQRVTVAPGGVAFVILQWDDNFKTHFPSGPAPETDLNIIGLDPNGEVLPFPNLFLFMDNAMTLEPVEVMLLINPSNAPMPVDVAILKFSGPDPKVLKWIDVAGAAAPLKIEEHDAGHTGTIFGHSQALGAMSLGAASAVQSSSPPAVEPYSSVGGGQISRDLDGQRMGTEATRLKPTFVGPDNANTSFFGEDSPDDADSLPNFAGTSAAAPHAAAVAALALEKVATATPADICNAIATTATDMGTPGVDAETGHGHIDAVAALTELTSAVKRAPSDHCKTATVSVASLNGDEGSAGAGTFGFKLTKLGKTASDVVVEYATVDGTATEASDYKRTTGTVTFTPADVTKVVEVEVTGDGEVEPDETFDLTIKLAEPAPANVLVANALGTARILDDDDPTNDAVSGVKNFVSWGEASPDTGSPGDTVRISGLGFKPNTELVGTFHSTPVALGSITSNAAGSFAAVATIPPVPSGRHHIEVTGENADGGTRTIRYAITVVNGVGPSVGGPPVEGNSPVGTVTTGTVTTETVPGVVQGGVVPTTSVTGTTAPSPTSLPTTGANVTFFAQLGSLLIVAGIAAIYGSRRRRPAQNC